METLKKSISAGMMIGIGSNVYLVMENKIIGSLLFSIGLFMICSFGMYLFTGKVGYIAATKNKPNCFLIWVGNLIGSVIVSAAVRIAKPGIHETAAQLVSGKLQQSLLSAAILSALCGVLMFLAVDNFRKHSDSISGITGIFLCVSTFILCGYEHSIADMNYCVLAVDSLNTAARAVVFLVIVSVFNGVGAVLMHFMTSARNEKSTSEKNSLSI